MTGVPDSTKNFELIADPKGPVANAFGAGDFSSSIVSSSHSLTIPKLLQVGGNGCVELHCFDGLVTQGRGESLHLVFKRFSIVLDLLGTHISARREHVAVLAYVVQLRCLAEAGHFDVRSSSLVTAPRVIGSCDMRHVVVAQFTMYSISQSSHLASVDEQCFSPPVAESSVLFISSKEPQADRNLCRIEKLPRQRDHAVHQVGFDDGLSNVTLPGLIRRH